MKSGRIIVLTVLVILAISMSVAAKPTVISVGTIESTTNPATLALYKMAEIAEEKSGGRLKIEVYPASQLGNAIAQLEGVMMGTQDMFQGAAEWAAQFVPDWNILALAFTFEDQDHLMEFLRSPINEEIKERYRQEFGVRVIADNWNRTPRVLLSTKPVFRLSDLSGIKMRVPEIEMYLRVWEALGTKPTQVAWGETYLALQQGIVDAMEGPFDTLYGMKFYEVAPYITLTNHLLTACFVVINDNTFQSLEPDLQRILVEAAHEAGDYFTNLNLDTYEQDMQQMISEGTVFIQTDMAPFRKVARELAIKLEAEGKLTAGLFDAIQELRK
ncbi:MAG: TRAP transporter substrate-binding protein [Limnochordia bacterium]|jgi:tripartite ATP-independent transporter DctP family solute receptor|nr:TRAP transporter substrate-binding protein [Bacillota bacterium]